MVSKVTLPAALKAALPCALISAPLTVMSLPASSTRFLLEVMLPVLPIEVAAVNLLPSWMTVVSLRMLPPAFRLTLPPAMVPELVLDIARGFDIEVVAADGTANIGQAVTIKIEVVGSNHGPAHDTGAGALGQVHDRCQHALSGDFGFNHPDDVAGQARQLLRARWLAKIQAKRARFGGGGIKHATDLGRFIAVALQDIAAGGGD